MRETVTRPRDESKEDKKARKQAVKAERQARRVDKKATKEQFSTEVKHQLKGIANKEKTKMRKLLMSLLMAGSLLVIALITGPLATRNAVPVGGA